MRTKGKFAEKVLSAAILVMVLLFAAGAPAPADAATATTVSFSATSLTFGSQLVGTSSGAQFTTLTNTGSATLTFSAVFSGDFAFAGLGTCGSSVAAGASCTISVKFTPTAAGTRTGTLTLTDNASNSPQTISLTGTGSITSVAAPSITTQPTSRTVTAGQTATFTVAATGTSPLTYQWKKSGSAISGATSSSYTTPATTSSDNGAQFTVVVSNSAGSVTSNATTLTVNSASAGLGVSPASLTFGSQTVGTASATQYITVTNRTTTTVTFTASFTGDFGFAGTGTCGSSVAAGASCTISVKFTPTAAGTRTGTLTLTDNAPNSPQTISLTGTGSTASVVAPSITTQPASQTVTVGQTATFTVVATGTSPLTYQWKKNGTSISGATSSSYTTPATTSSDNGAQFTVVVSNSAGSVTSNAATLTVNASPQPLQITTGSLPGGQTQTSYSASLQATGGTAPYAWSVISAQLPNGLSLSPANGTITGIPTLAGAFTFTIQVKDNSGGIASAAFSISIATQSLTPQFGHVAIVVEENTNYANAVGSTSMPYLNSLIKQYGLATQYYANTHPSIGNYMMLTTGQILTNDDSQTPSSFPVSADNIAREIELAGKTWKDYRELTGTYYVRHDPLAYMTNINSANLVSFPQFGTDLANGTLPNFSWIAPNGCDDAHDCSLSTADTWLQTNIDPLIKNATFQKDGLLVIVFDESANDNTSGGGRVAAVLISPAFSHVAYQSTTFYQHESVLRLMLAGLGIKTLPGAAASAPPMWEFFDPPAVTTTPLAISTTSLPAGTDGQGYSAQLNATGGTAPYAWSVASGALPVGLTLSSSGAISGVPSVAGTSTFTVKLTDLNLLTVQQSFSITSSSGTACASTGSGVCYYVSPTGSDSNAGTSAAPFLTIQHAADVVNPGDMVIVRDGTYNNPAVSGVGSKLIVMSRGGTAANHVVFTAEHKWGAKIDGLNNTSATGWEFSANYIDVKDFECYGFSDTCMENYNGGSSSGGQFISITGNNIHWAGWDFHQQRQRDDRREPNPRHRARGTGGSTLWRYLRGFSEHSSLSEQRPRDLRGCGVHEREQRDYQEQHFLSQRARLEHSILSGGGEQSAGSE